MLGDLIGWDGGLSPDHYTHALDMVGALPDTSLEVLEQALEEMENDAALCMDQFTTSTGG